MFMIRLTMILGKPQIHINLRKVLQLNVFIVFTGIVNKGAKSEASLVWNLLYFFA